MIMRPNARREFSFRLQAEPLRLSGGELSAGRTLVSFAATVGCGTPRPAHQAARRRPSASRLPSRLVVGQPGRLTHGERESPLAGETACPTPTARSLASRQLLIRPTPHSRITDD